MNNTDSHICDSHAEGRSLDTKETNVDFCLPEVKWGRVRTLSLELARLLKFMGYERKANNLFWCNSDYAVYINSAGEFRVSGQKCKDRLCPSCQIIRSRKLVHKYTELAESMTYPVLLTLSLKVSSGLECRIEHARKSLKRFKEQLIWKKNFKGYVCSMEVKVSKDKTTKEPLGWFVHYHILADLPSYVGQEALSKAWFKATGDSYICDIRKANERGLVEVLKYITKITDFADDKDLLGEYIEATSGRHMVSTGGNLRGRVTDEELDEETGDWTYLGSLKEVMDRVNLGFFEKHDIAILAFASRFKYIEWGTEYAQVYNDS